LHQKKKQTKNNLPFTPLSSGDKESIPRLSFALNILLNTYNQKNSIFQTQVGLALYQGSLDKKVRETHTNKQTKQGN